MESMIESALGVVDEEIARDAAVDDETVTEGEPQAQRSAR